MPGVGAGAGWRWSCSQHSEATDCRGEVRRLRPLARAIFADPTPGPLPAPLASPPLRGRPRPGLPRGHSEQVPRGKEATAGSDAKAGRASKTRHWPVTWGLCRHGKPRPRPALPAPRGLAEPAVPCRAFGGAHTPSVVPHSSPPPPAAL
ncbi:unnamed protein product [Rangifer tarandus platyrhynchus]|uniref:Uncharacterized protein n=1 Tax=Rangifer tarandus platyrhynchus TaxID=3082113 RepID=A0ABN9A3Q3_RANTA|nr:unnamed protein product [Rangifer tarandus platyrhynchus]